MARPALTLAAIVLATLTLSATEREAIRMQEPHVDTAGYVARTYTSGSRTMPYRLFTPKGYDRKQQYPLIVWLHGAGGMGTDNLMQISGDQIAGTQLWITPGNQAKHPAFVVAPQSDVAWTSELDSADLRPDSRMVAGILDAIGREFTIDQRRIYLIGQSLGASAAWNLAINQPARVAAAVLVCPSQHNVTRSERAAQLPVWIFQGEEDKGLIETTREMVAIVTRAGGHPRFTVYRGEGHDIWTRAFSEPDLIEWLFGQMR